MRLSEIDIVSRVHSISLRRLRLWVDQGWVAPEFGADGPMFDEVDVARIRLICELKSEFGMNDGAVPVVLSLIDQVHGLRRELHGFARAVEEQPTDIRDRILEALRAARAR